LELIKRPPMVGATVRAGVHTNFGALTGPSVALEGDVRLAFVHRNLFLALGAGYSTAARELAQQSPIAFTVATRTHAVPVNLSLLYRLRLGERGLLYGGGGGDALFVQSRLQPSFETVPRVENSAVLGFHARAGAGYELGGGALIADLRYTRARLPDGGALSGDIGGLTATAGYRFSFF
ncbi:MAG: hypothetical protein ACK4N5_17660, partial [Myxococcales bacterium]